jgi:hypothetical protein
LFFWNSLVTDYSEDRNKYNKYINTCLVINCPTGCKKFLDLIIILHIDDLIFETNRFSFSGRVSFGNAIITG